MSKVAAVYCVYEDSGFLAESVRRVYPLVDKIIFMLNFRPWNGEGSNHHIELTYRTILEMFDPNRKIEVISGYWTSEAEQRNYSLKICRDRGIDWNFIIDDDELYNYDQLRSAMDQVKHGEYWVYLSPQQVYWKNRSLCIANVVDALPSFTLAHEGKTFFNYARALTVNGGNWYTFQPHELINHHMSYVRDDEKMLRKIKSFSHADPAIIDWYKNTWIKWKPESQNLHPNKDNPGSFSRAIDAQFSLYRLEDCVIRKDSNLERLLKKTEIVQTPDLEWLKSDDTVNHIIDFYYKLTKVLLDSNKTSFLDVGTEFGHVHYAACEAILKSGKKAEARSISLNRLGSTNETYKSFSSNTDMGSVASLHWPKEFDMIHFHKQYLKEDDFNFLLNQVTPNGLVCVSGTQTYNAELFKKLRTDSYIKPRPYYEFKHGNGFAVIEWSR